MDIVPKFMQQAQIKKCFIDTIKTAKKKGFRKIRSDIRLEEIMLANVVSIQD